MSDLERITKPIELPPDATASALDFRHAAPAIKHLASATHMTPRWFASYAGGCFVWNSLRALWLSDDDIHYAKEYLA
jgi:hypothetical protein